MSGFNVVQFTVKNGMDDTFLDIQKNLHLDIPGLKQANLIKTGDHDYCFIAEWDSASDSLNAEDRMVAMLNQFRDTLEDRGDGKGVTEAIVGDTIVEYH